ncbi:hypothetical protein INH39_23130 [Massilia violaceinigra]|uniref:DUF2059 domain-containing protein n=1 Tax=Massilia violaceinigra TaxID=2045208 RepID=A0ABY4A0P6_9BURK|nr:hypothetical protein [Massilia violaceinigra]UOD28326.1 hypothetical protein INH39_23130 [Massilia violaceinigra]
MHASLMNAGRYAATALVFTMAMAQAHAAPATKETVRKYFDVTKASSLTDNVVETISAMQAKERKEETNPKEKAKKKAMYDQTNKVIRKYVKWSALEPIAIESYQKELDEADVQGMIVHAQSPAGQIITNKMTPAIIKQLPAVGKHLEQRIETLSAQKAGAKTPAPVPPAPPANPKEAMARTLLSEMPGAREEFAAMTASMEARMIQNVNMVMGEGGSSGMEPEMKRIAKLFKEQVTFDEIVALKARMLASDLSEADMSAVIEDNKKPARRAQLIKAKKAEAAMQARMNTYLQETIMPVMVPELMKTLGKK